MVLTKTKTITKNQILLVVSTILLFAITVVVLNPRKYITSENSRNTRNPHIEEPKKTLIPITLKETNVDGKILYVKEGILFSFDPNTRLSQPVLFGANVEQPGMLADGRLYYWEKEGTVYNKLFIQKDQSFEKYSVPLEINDGGFGPATPPLIFPDGRKILFTSDRDAKDTYHRRALYLYDLETYEAAKLTDNSLLNVYIPFISKDNSYIGFTYQNLESAKNSYPTALGIIEASTKTVNLFPKIIVGTLSASFGNSLEDVFFTGVEGVSVFDLSKGKTGETLGTGKLISIGPNHLVAVQDEVAESKKTLLQSCNLDNTGKNNPEPAGELVLYTYEKNMFKQVASLAQTEYIIRFQPLSQTNYFSPDGKKMLVEYQDKEHCQPTFGILDIASLVINPIPEINSEYVFWSYKAPLN